jgi:ASC-1-like (ASCH) protein
MTHELKILPEYFKAVVKGKKTFEIRTNDRPFKVNDHILLKEWTGNDYTGNEIKVRIKYILDDENYLKKNTIAMSIEILDNFIYPSGSTTEITIDYYEELKRKADKYDNGKIIIDMVENIIIGHGEAKNAPPLPVIAYSQLSDYMRKSKLYEEKETPKPPLINDFKMFSSEQCPSCGKTLWEGILNYCDKCGQRLKR